MISKPLCVPHIIDLLKHSIEVPDPKNGLMKLRRKCLMLPEFRQLQSHNSISTLYETLKGFAAQDSWPLL